MPRDPRTGTLFRPGIVILKQTIGIVQEGLGWVGRRATCRTEHVHFMHMAILYTYSLVANWEMKHSQTLDEKRAQHYVFSVLGVNKSGKEQRG